MAKPVPSMVQLPDDSGNTGKKVRTQTRVVGANTVHEHFFTPVSEHDRLGSFLLGSSQQSVQAAAQNATATGFLWLQLPAAATIDAIIRSWSVEYNTSSTTAAPTAPVIALARFTFSGTASGASISPAKARASESANQLIARTAVTGMTVSLAGQVASSSVPSVLTGVGQVGLKDWLLQEGRDLEANDIRLVSGEGLVLYQIVAGTASDPRRFSFDVKWDEVANS